MKKIPRILYFAVMALCVLSLSGCSGGGGSGASINQDIDTSEVKQVAVLTSPAFEMYSDYKIFMSVDLSGMKGAQYYVAGDLGDETSQTTLNLGFSEEFDANSSLAVVNASTGRVVFAYDPSGTSDTWKTGGNISISGGKLLSYNSLTINQENQSSVSPAMTLNTDAGDITYIALNSTYATITAGGSSTAVPRYTYVWHAEPDYRYEYFTKGIYGAVVGSPMSGVGYEYESDFLANDNSVYIARDIRYMTSNANFTGIAAKDEESEYAAYYSDSVASALSSEYGSSYAGPYIFATLPNIQGSSLSAIQSSMTHSASDAYNNPVLHITAPGVYSLSGIWTGQISIEADAIVILNGVSITCTVAPALVFTDSANEYGDNDETSVAAASMDIGQELLDSLDEAQANVLIIADGTTNTVTGANVYRLMKAEPKSSATKVNGSDVSDQIKRYKLDSAIYSYVSLAICGGDNGTGVLNVNSSTFEGLDSELHMTVESGKINITAPDDGINVNEDNVSVFTQLGGTLTIKSTRGDGIDSNGYIVINCGNLNITAGTQRVNANGEAGLDSEKGYYVSSNANYTWTSINGSSSGTNNPPSNPVPTPAPGSTDVPADTDTDTGETTWQQIQRNNSNYTSDTTTKEESYKYNDADVLKAAKQTDKGITAINIGTGSNLSFIQEDTDPKARTISTSGNIFRLDRKINTFSGITH